jgi:hypothetical protein
MGQSSYLCKIWRWHRAEPLAARRCVSATAEKIMIVQVIDEYPRMGTVEAAAFAR